VRANAVKGSCPSSSYCGSDMRAAYYGGTALTGAGQTVGLLEYYGYDIADVKTTSRTPSKPTRFRSGRFHGWNFFELQISGL